MSLTLVMLHVTFLPQFISTLPQLINSTATTIIIMLVIIVIIEIVLSSSHHFFLFLSRITSHCLSYSILSNLFLYCSSNKGIKENEWKEMEGKETCCKHIYYTWNCVMSKMILKKYLLEYLRKIFERKYFPLM